MGLTPDYAELDRINAEALAARERRERARRTPPLVRLWEPTTTDLQLRGVVRGERSCEVEWKANATGSGELVLPYEHHLAQWAMRWWERDKRNIVLTVDHVGERWSGLMENVTTRQDERGDRTVTLSFLHDFEHLNHLPVWSNPMTPPMVQFPKSFMLYGPAAYILKVALFLNILRHNTSLWQLPDDPLDPESWLQGLDYRRWPILVQPRSIIHDATPWRFLHSRFDNYLDVATPILDEARLLVTCRRWLIGDPQPWPGAGLNRNGQLIIDIVDKSGWWEQTATGGTIAHGLLRTGLEVADNLVDESRRILERPADAPEYAVSGFLGTAPAQPWVVYRTNGAHNTATSTEYVYRPATVGQVTVGGKSAPGVNEFTSATTKFIFNVLGSFILQPALGGVVDTALNPLYSDVMLAFMSVKSPMRTRNLGWGHLMENFAAGGDQAYTLASLMALRAGFRETDEEVSHSIKVGDGAPYLIGAPGHGHFTLGDRIGVEIPGSREGRVDVEQVTRLALGWDAETPHEWEVTIGAWPRQDPIEFLLNKVRNLSAGLQEVGLL